MKSPRRVLWWGHFDPDYSRNRIIRKLLHESGWKIVDFRPVITWIGDREARLRHFGQIDLVWVPCFRQRDILAASRWAKAHAIPHVIDPLISAYDKQVFERSKFPSSGRKAGKLLAWERRLFQCADRVVADTQEHANFFHEILGVARERLRILYVGAEEPLFHPAPARATSVNEPLHVLFFGSFIELQAPRLIVAAARAYQGPPVSWHFLGGGPLLTDCRKLAAGLTNVTFEDRIPYNNLPQRIHRADLLLGIFGTTQKAGRVIPNKVYQALACGRVVLSRQSEAYPLEIRNNRNSGILWVKPGSAQAIADQVEQLATHKERLASLSRQAFISYERFFSNRQIKAQLDAVLAT